MSSGLSFTYFSYSVINITCSKQKEKNIIKNFLLYKKMQHMLFVMPFHRTCLKLNYQCYFESFYVYLKNMLLY